MRCNISLTRPSPHSQKLITPAAAPFWNWSAWVERCLHSLWTASCWRTRSFRLSPVPILVDIPVHRLLRQATPLLIRRGSSPRSLRYVTRSLQASLESSRARDRYLRYRFRLESFLFCLALL